MRELEREREKAREREKEREKEREREGERERERPNTKSKIRQKNLPRQFSRLLTPAPSLSVFSRESPARDMWCFVAYVYNGREREERGERERETERVPCRIILLQ